MERTFSIVTIGCKLNQFESESIRESLVRTDWVFRKPGEAARFCIINSCTVTGRSDARCRNAVRRIRKMSPEAFIIVTGCYAETQPESLSAMPEVDLVLGNGAKRAIPAILEEIVSSGDARLTAAALATASPSADDPPIERFLDHSRAFVKIQDGCDASCSYCIVPRARGPSRSVPPHTVLRQAETLERHGYHEIVLTGVHIGRYGADLDRSLTLASLVELILRRTRNLRLRLSSIEPTEVAPSLVELLTSGSGLAPHLHVPLQSGDDGILEAMRRPYRVQRFRELIESLARAKPGLAIGTDIIVGFPGETDERFDRTARLLRELPISYVHVFSFSPRPGTAAATMPDQVSPETKRRRSNRLIEIGAAKKRSFARDRIGTMEVVLIEGPARRISRFARCLTGSYCTVFVPHENAVPRSLARVRITHYSRGNLYGSIVDSCAESGASVGGEGG